MVNCKTVSAMTIAALMAAALPAQLRSFPAAAKAVDLAFSPESVAKFAAIAQAAPSFSVPDLVPRGTKIRISSSSDNMNTISALLQKGFEGTYAGSSVDIQAKSVDAALQDVLNDNADLAAISRPLTDAEKAKGLIAVPVRREKIAIIVNQANPFSQSLTGSQFAQIFRGEIKDWAEVGGAAGPIRVIDRAATSETRQSLQPYPVFKTAPFQTSDNATQLPEESTEALMQALGKDGISYALVGEIEGQSELKAIALHQTLPTDPRYPFSQPYSFVYVGGASQSVQAFLGYATGNPGQAALNDANLTGDGVIAAAANSTAGTAGNAANPEGATGTATGAATVGADTATGNPPGTTPDDGTGSVTDEASGNASEGNVPGGTSDTEASGAIDSLTAQGRWWWLLLPLAGLGLLLWAAGKRSTEEETGYLANTDGASPAGLATMGSNEPDEIHSNLDHGAEYDSADSDAANSDFMTNLSDTPSAESLSTGLPNVPIDPIDHASHIDDGSAAVIGAAVSTSAAVATPELWTQPTEVADEGVRTSMQADVIGIRPSLDNPDQLDNLEQFDNRDNVDNLDQVDDLNFTQSEAQPDIHNIQSSLLENAGSTGATAAATTAAHEPDSWLERAKRRINEATEQIKEITPDMTTDAKTDTTEDTTRD